MPENEAYVNRRPKPEIGYTREYDRLQGKRVRIPKGVPVESYKPGPFRIEWETTRRAQTILVDHVLPGSSEVDHDGAGLSREYAPVTDPMVRWGGSGGYWRGVPVQYVEEID